VNGRFFAVAVLGEVPRLVGEVPLAGVLASFDGDVPLVGVGDVVVGVVGVVVVAGVVAAGVVGVVVVVGGGGFWA
jgi:hypothetical protein